MFSGPFPPPGLDIAQLLANRLVLYLVLSFFIARKLLDFRKVSMLTSHTTLAHGFF
jgi:hypothetical protein